MITKLNKYDVHDDPHEPHSITISLNIPVTMETSSLDPRLLLLKVSRTSLADNMGEHFSGDILLMLSLRLELNKSKLSEMRLSILKSSLSSEETLIN